jgi:DNA polymerase
MQTLNIDIETYSSVDIKKSGLYKYVQSPDFQIMLFAYSLNRSPVQIVDLMQGEHLPPAIIAALNDNGVTKYAYNAAFEWYCLNKFILSPLEQWSCTMVQGMYCGYPGSLASINSAMGFKDDKKKMGVGMSLIRTFCIPCKPTAKNGMRTRTLPQHEPGKWSLFKNYCKQDVVAEMGVADRLVEFPLPAAERKLWMIDQHINAYGARVDMELVIGALHCSEVSTNNLMSEAIGITGLSNPKSRDQLKKWLETELGEQQEGPTPIENMQKGTIAKLLETVDEGKGKRMLEIRLELAKTSVKKYQAMDTAVCADGRVRGLIQFYGANRTGRAAGRLVQIQNLPKNFLKSLDHARESIKYKKTEVIKVIYGNVPDTLSQLIRTAFIPSDGHVLLVADFSAIEARIIAWWAGEQWVMDVFASHGRIYEAAASQMFGVSIDKITKGNPEYSLRSKGKVATLALGYQGGTRALEAMGALDMGLTEEELPDIVRRWRAANKRIVDLWYAVENAAVHVMRTGQTTAVRGVQFALEGTELDRFFTVKLPSGRKLYYVNPFLEFNKFGKEALHHYGQNQETKKWEVMSTYGGKLVENCTQAIARDCLYESLSRLYQAGYQTVFHVHDEVILDVPADNADIHVVEEIMGRPISWAPGLLLKAEGFMANYYKKE